MKRKCISEIIEQISPKYIEEAAAYEGKGKPSISNSWIKWAGAVACLAVAVTLGVLLLPKLWKNNAPDTEVLVGGILRDYKDMDIIETETVAVVWPWEDMTVEEQYTEMRFQGQIYRSRVSHISSALLGASLGSCEAIGYDAYTGEEMERTFPVYEIPGVDSEWLVAVKLDDIYCVFMNDRYEPASTFGEFMDRYDLSNTLTLSRFTQYEGYDGKGHYMLSEDDYIWQVLSGCRDGQFIGEEWSRDEKEYISFTATSEALGIYKKVMYISEDGYVWTNMFEWAFVYDIGEEAAGNILTYTKEHGKETIQEPYYETLAGTVTEVTEGYILVDDSILCKNQEDGMVFKILTEDIRASRYVRHMDIKAGDFVMVEFTGKVDMDSGNTIDSARSISRAAMTDEGWMVPE